MVFDDNSIAQLRQQMVEHQLRRRGIRDHRVLRVMGETPRELFIPQVSAEQAYGDHAMEIAAGQTISQPFIVAYMTERLNLQPADRVLEIGTGSGYQTAILSRLSQAVYTVESIAELAASAQNRLADLGYQNIFFRVGDGTEGWADQAPFDKIMVTAGGPYASQPLLEQLKIGGQMIIPIGEIGGQYLVWIERQTQGFRKQKILSCRFVKLIGQYGWPE